MRERLKETCSKFRPKSPHFGGEVMNSASRSGPIVYAVGVHVVNASFVKTAGDCGSMLTVSLGITGYATDATKNFVHTTRTQTKVAPKSDEVKIRFRM